MENKEKIWPDADEVSKIFKDIRNNLERKDYNTLEVLTALVAITIQVAMQSGLPKVTLLSYLSEHWEMNDPENTNYPMRETAKKIEIKD